MSESKTRGAGRTRSWTCVLYPESAAANWRDVLDEMYMPWVCSPLHDRDVNADGAVKKPHWHLLLLFDTVKEYHQVAEICKQIAATVPQKVHSVRAMVRYMAHLDNPDKAQYSVSDIVQHGGVDLTELLRKSASERYSIIAEMMDYVVDNDIIEMVDLVMYARRERMDDWFPALCDNAAYIMREVIQSQRHKPKHPITTPPAYYRLPRNKIDPDTGEVLED